MYFISVGTRLELGSERMSLVDKLHHLLGGSIAPVYNGLFVIIKTAESLHKLLRLDAAKSFDGYFSLAGIVVTIGHIRYELAEVRALIKLAVGTAFFPDGRQKPCRRRREAPRWQALFVESHSLVHIFARAAYNAAYVRSPEPEYENEQASL